MNKWVDKDSDKNLLKRAGLALADSTVSSTPGLAQAWALSRALFGSAMELRNERALEWVKMIHKNPGVFTEDLMNSEEFQDGFAVALEDYITLRNKDKRSIARKVFTGFATSKSKQNFPMERYNDTLAKISSEGLVMLAFLDKTILPLREKAIKKELATENLGTEKPYEWWLEQKRAARPISKDYEQWVHDEYNPNSKKLIKKYNLDLTVVSEKTQELFEKERVKRAEDSVVFSELEYLGLIRAGFSGGVGWNSTGGMTWALTRFAYEFIDYVIDSKNH